MSDKITVEAVKRFRAKPCKHLKDTFYRGNLPCDKCKMEELEKANAELVKALDSCVDLASAPEHEWDGESDSQLMLCHAILKKYEVK